MIKNCEQYYFLNLPHLNLWLLNKKNWYNNSQWHKKKGVENPNFPKDKNLL